MAVLLALPSLLQPRLAASIDASPALHSRRQLSFLLPTILLAPRSSCASAQPTAMRTIENAVASPIDGGLGQMALYPNPLLRQVAAPVTHFGPRLQRFGELLLTSMTSDAIAASQYGVDARVILLRNAAAGDSASSPPLLLVNPRVVARSDEERMQLWREICLVFPPDLEVELLRDEWVQVEAFDAFGRPFSRRLRGESARAFQHELDHLNGVLIVDHAGLAELPESIQRIEMKLHSTRQQRAFQRPIDPKLF